MGFRERPYGIPSLSLFACAWALAGTMNLLPAASAQDIQTAQSSPARKLKTSVTPRLIPKQREEALPSPGGRADNLGDKETRFAKALASCDAGETQSDFSLPGLKSEVKLDRCYRGRQQLNCRLQKIASEEQALIQEFTRIVDLKYPDINGVEALCKLGQDSLSADFRGAAEFLQQFRAFEAEYQSRIGCANKVKDSLKDVSLPDLVQAPEMLKSMMDAIDQDMANVLGAHEQITNLSSKIDASRKAIAILQKIHKAMCPLDNKPAPAAGDRPVSPAFLNHIPASLGGIKQADRERISVTISPDDLYDSLHDLKLKQRGANPGQ